MGLGDRLQRCKNFLQRSLEFWIKKNIYIQKIKEVLETTIRQKIFKVNQESKTSLFGWSNAQKQYIINTLYW